MVTSLAAQLANQTSLNADRLKTKARHRHYGYSYLFSDQEAGQHDLDSILSLAQNGYTALLAIDPSLSQQGETLLSSAARATDRTIMPRDQVQDLQKSIRRFLQHLSKYLLEAPADKIIEWLVRRFRVNEFDIDAVLEAYLPYHESVQFTKMLSILTVSPNSTWSFLLPFKQAGKPLARTALVTAMTKDVDLARFVSSLAHNALDNGTLHTALTNFSTSVLVEYVSRAQSIDETVLGFFLPSISRVISSDAGADSVLGGFVILSSLSQRCQLTPKALSAVLLAMVQAGHRVSTPNLLASLIAVCAAQEELDSFPPEIVESLSKIKLLPESIAPTLRWRGADKFYLPLFASMHRRTFIKWAPAILAITNSLASLALIERLTKFMLERYLDILTMSPNDEIFSLLSVVYQRHRETFKAATHAIPDRMTEKMTRLLTILALGVPVGDEIDSFLAARSDDVQVRESGLSSVMSALGKPDVEEEFLRSAREILLANLEGSDLSILRVIYNSPGALLKACAAEELLSTILKTLAGSDLSRSRSRLHLRFLAVDLCSADPGSVKRVFEEAFTPLLLFTKPRQKHARLAWEVLLSSDSGLAEHPLVRGCAEETSCLSEDGEVTTGRLSAINTKITDTIARNILTSDDYDQYSDFFLSKINDPDSHTCKFSLLIVRSLLNILSGEHQVDAARKVLKNIGLDSLDSLKDVLVNAQSLGDFISYDAFGESVAGKPNSATTRHRLQASIIALLPGISKPVNCQISWLQHIDEPGDNRGVRYAKFARRLYGLANSSSSLHALSTNLVRAMFINLKDEALLFLAGVWTDLAVDSARAENLRLAALSHAKAFLLAYKNDEDRVVDFQVIVPSLLVALRSSDRRVRVAALNNLELIVGMSASQRSAVYALDEVYGNSSACVQILDLPDLRRYLSSLVEKQGGFVVDSSYLQTFHREALIKHPGDTKKIRGYKQRILCSLLTHAVSWGNIRGRLVLIDSLQQVQDPAKLPLLLPLVRELVNAGHQLQIGPLATDETEHYHRLVFGAYDSVASSHINSAESDAWDLFKGALYFSIDLDANASIRSVPLLQLRSVLFSALTKDRRVASCLLLLGLACSSRGVNDKQIKGTLSSIVTDNEVTSTLLSDLSPNTPGTEQPPTKRTRIDHAGPSDDGAKLTEDQVSQLTLLAELLASRPLNATPEIVSAIINTLRTLSTHHEKPRSDYDYIQQLLLSALDSCVDHLSPASFGPGLLRIDVLVEIMRATDNPQTFQQALLVVSTMARIAPESVLHHIMPIFTFMGSNVFHRDDTYSFRVVQKTVDSIVPVMVESLKEKHQDALQLLLGSREFLRIFTDASNHVPRHRRTQFFMHLTQVLGPFEYLPSVCMLLVDKIASRVVRQASNETAHTLALPLIILQQHEYAVQLKVYIECLRECQRLVRRMDNPDQDRASFLEFIPGDHATAGTNWFKKEILALLIFVGHGVQGLGYQALPQTEVQGLDNATQELVRLSVALSVVKSASGLNEYDDINKMARNSLSKVLSTISASEFIHAVGALLGADDEKIRNSGLELLEEGIPRMSESARQTLHSLVVTIIGRIQSLLPAGPSSTYALRALRVMSNTGLAIEHAALAQTIPAVVDAGQRPEGVLESLQVLGILSSSLGPRLIPYLKGIVQVASQALKVADSSEPNEDLRVPALQVYQNLLSSNPIFLGSELDSMITSCIALQTVEDSDDAATQVLGTISGSIPTKTLLPVLLQLWSNVYQEAKSDLPLSIAPFFQLVGRSLASAPRLDVMEQLKGIFKMFLEAFDLRSSLAEPSVELVEGAVTSAFTELVTKLNEATFKPLFRRLFDWAFTSDMDTRKTTFVNTMSVLFEMFKGLLTPYMSTILEPVIQLLEEAGQAQPPTDDLWLATLKMIQASLDFDESAFWRDDRLGRLLPSLVKQVSVKQNLDRGAVYECLSAFTAGISHEELLQSLNVSLLMETRAEESKIQLSALGALSEIWKRAGSRLEGFASETLVFVEDLAESDNDQVAKNARTFKRIMDAASRGQVVDELDS